MKKSLIFITAIGTAYFIVVAVRPQLDSNFPLVGGFSVAKAQSKNILNFFSLGNNRFSGKVTGTDLETKPLPLVVENHQLATEFQPLLKSYAPYLNIPTAHASVVMDVDSGKILYANNADQERQIASLTKLFTALIVMERMNNLEELITVDEEAVYADGTRVGCPRSGFCNGERLHVGEKMSAYDLLRAMLMNSANDAAILLGKHIGKTQSGFANIMNARAQELGLNHSHFCTPSGLEPEGNENECFSSASDIAKIATLALKYPLLWEIMRLDKVVINSSDGKYYHEIVNTDQLLGRLPNLIGTKTGFTPLAGYSLLAVASDDSRQHKIIAVVLDDNFRWQSIQSMFDWSFAAFHWK